jgi:hypothetical protein
MPKQITLLNSVEITYKDDNIFRYRFLHKSNITVDVAKAMVDLALDWAKDCQYTANLVDTREMAFIDSAARKYLAEQSSPKLQGVALVINSKVQKALANLYFKISRPVKETKMFENVDEAEKWLKQILIKKGSK